MVSALLVAPGGTSVASPLADTLEFFLKKGDFMVSNIGPFDRFIRLILGVVIVGLGILYQSYWGWLAFIPFATAAMSWCPIYRILGINSCDKNKITKTLGRV
jgi:hypothetical protein